MQTFFIGDIVMVNGDRYQGLGRVIGVGNFAPADGADVPRGFKADQPFPQVQVVALEDLVKPGRTIMFNADDLAANKLSLVKRNQDTFILDVVRREQAYALQAARKGQ